MASVNRCIILGGLTKDPEIRYTGSGKPVCDLRIATGESYTDSTGAKKESTEYHSVVVWGKTAENCAQYLAKGRTVYVEGRLQTRSWEKDGTKHYKTEVVADRVQFIGGGKGESKSAPSGDYEAAPSDDSGIPF